jgi:DeoR family transcriptional regulator, fructose operon transcriptional repressor
VNRMSGRFGGMVAMDRQRRIAELIRTRGSARASELVDLFGVTDETIRRDLASLDQRGVVRRAHGGAVSVPTPTRDESDFNRRLVEREAEKIAIGRAAAEFVADGSTIIIDSGTTTLHLARALADKRDLVVVTNAVSNANELLKNPGITVVLTGGVVRPLTLDAVGDLAINSLRNLHVDQTFLSIHAISLDGGLTYPRFEEVAVKQAMINAASEVILVADSSKFGHNALMSVAPLTALRRVITSPGLDHEFKEALEEMGIDVVVVSPILSEELAV